MDLSFEIAIVAVFLVATVFSMFGQGGGSVYTPTLVLLGYAVLVSISTSLVLNLVTAAFATVVYYRSGLVDLRLSGVLVPGIVAGAFLGGVWGNQANTTILLWIFVAFLVGAGARMVASYWERPGLRAAAFRPRLTVLAGVGIAGFSFGVGILSGLLGVGGGVVLIPFLIFALHVPTKVSAGTTAFVVVFSSLAGVLGHSSVGNLDAGLIVGTAIAVAIGGFLGAKLMIRTGANWVKLGFGLLLWALALQLIAKLLGWM